jgi:sterol desaturase/sphingolipid hydroxylase (fatty acid hydroxylase superfamily)
MQATWLDALAADYHWGLSAITLVAIFALNLVLAKLVLLVPAFRNEDARNRKAYAEKMAKPNYAANQKWNRKWGGIFVAIIFALIMPFCLTAQPQPWWQVLVDMVVILMVYDFVYYLTHRFAFHDANGRQGPLTWMHAVHHRQHNPCRGDSSYIHPLEVAIGLGLYIGTIFVLARFMGDFHVVTVVVTWIVFSQVNLHNHDLWESDRFPFRYLAHAAEMHHNHHAKFTGGNFATITLLYDWMFGTLDHGDEHRARIKAKAKRAEAATLEKQATT